MNGWVAVGLHMLSSENTPLTTGPLTNEQLSWIGSVNALGAILGTFVFAFITMRFECKNAMLFISLPCILFWILIYFGDTYFYILFARFCTGEYSQWMLWEQCLLWRILLSHMFRFIGWCGGGVQTTIILYIAEISNDKWVN